MLIFYTPFIGYLLFSKEPYAESLTQPFLALNQFKQYPHVTLEVVVKVVTTEAGNLMILIGWACQSDILRIQISRSKLSMLCSLEFNLSF